MQKTNNLRLCLRVWRRREGRVLPAGKNKPPKPPLLFISQIYLPEKRYTLTLMVFILLIFIIPKK